MNESKMPFSRSILWILVSTLLISGSAFMGWLYYLHVRERRLHDDQYHIVAIIQSTPQTDSLKSVYLAELLDLSLDRPTNLYQFNTKKGIQILLSNPLIKKAMIKKILPGTLFIHYQMRVPVAYIGDLANTVIDEEGVLFPFRPFFTPKRLPTIYLGLNTDECHWGRCLIEYASVNLSFSILKQCEYQLGNFKIKQLDVAQAQADSYGQRQIVLVLEGNGKEEMLSTQPLIFLRLSSDHYAQELASFRTLQSANVENQAIQMKDDQSVVIDLRIPHLAFIKRGD
jgi:hypothetical protein